MVMEFNVFPIGEELGKSVLASASNPLNSENDHTGDGSFIAKVIRNVGFCRPRYLLASAGDTVKIYFLEGKGGLIYSVSRVGSSNDEDNSEYLHEGHCVEFKTDHQCLITLACTSPSNTVVYWLE
ncbi:EFc gene family protein [Canarypox virus]|uniref:CNPV321 EFc-like protein n=1 Tax=Canarypox virus TaxID=44088 RepID=Q6VZ26_CNPV|nr:EFc gene family protein [Canarypox virus]AAR83667.1 CNPV321 EFc-like protein [Canarypox virus]AWD84797.1 EFc family protein [Canarypox virus]